MNAALLQTQLQLPYRRASWFSAAGLLPQILPGRPEFFERSVDIALLSVEERKVATGFRQLGRMVLPVGDHGPERIVALHEIDVAPNVDLIRNRVGLRRLVARNIDEVTAHAVLAFFVQPGETAYRLTYAARESVMNLTTLAVEQRETATRRFTYVLGPGDTRRTAALRLAGLAADRARGTLDSLTAAFAVESLNKEFFDHYRAHYEAFRDYLLGTDAPTRAFGIPAPDLAPTVDAKLRDRALKPVRDFVKKLLGRIVFLHFLQKKGWLGCPAATTDWTHGDPDFLNRLFKQSATADRFHSERLVPLFYDTLNRPDRPGQLFAVTGTRVPYLNGGLFERDFPGVAQLDFPGDLFAHLFEFLGGYHFTIDENDPEDHEIGIDPEMLGHIFENLLEDNKDKGAYYTPKAVVHYMARQSLVHALTARFPGDAAAPTEIAHFLRLKEPVDPRTPSWLATHATDLARHLDDLRICDPAIGSGAFPIGLLHEIYWAKLALNPSLNRAAAKRAIIQNSIHGVDLDAGAVEIARLRFWLALVVDEAAPSPLPNLDYQIMQGNSLLESFEGERLDDLAEPVRYGIRRLGSDQHELDLGAPPEEIIEISTPPQQQLTDLRTAYFRCHDPVEKARLRGEIDAAVLRAIDARLDRRRDELEISLQSEAALVRDRERTARETRRRAEMETELAGLRGKTTRLHALLADPRAERPFFLWHLWFRHVLAEAPEGRGGFDIVIANPPYVVIGKEDFQKTYGTAYPLLSGKPDLYRLFVEHSIRLPHVRGVVCVIVPNTLLAIPSAEPLRRFLTENTCIRQLIDLTEPVFGAVAVNNIIVLLSREPAPGSVVLAGAADAACNFPLPEAMEQIEQQSWLRNSRCEWQIHAAGAAGPILTKIGAAGTELGQLVQGLTLGLQVYHNTLHSPEQIEARYLHSDRKHGPMWLPEFGGRHIDYVVSTSKSVQFVNYASEAIYMKPEIAYFRGARILLREIVADRLNLAFTTDELVVNKSCYVLRDDRFSQSELKSLLAVLRSKVIGFWIKSKGDKAKQALFPRITMNTLKALPIPTATSEEQAELTARVDAILAAKQAGDAARVAALEAEIDAIVYRLYGLTAPEIALIEGRTS